MDDEQHMCTPNSKTQEVQSVHNPLDNLWGRRKNVHDAQSSLLCSANPWLHFVACAAPKAPYAASRTSSIEKNVQLSRYTSFNDTVWRRRRKQPSSDRRLIILKTLHHHHSWEPQRPNYFCRKPHSIDPPPPTTTTITKTQQRLTLICVIGLVLICCCAVCSWWCSICCISHSPHQK